MAPPRQPRSAGGRKRPRAAGGGIALMPEDMLREVLLRLPPKAAIRFRAVCRAWHATHSDPRFVAMHVARGCPLLVAGTLYRSSTRSGHVDLLDLAGDIVRQTRTEEGIIELFVGIESLSSLSHCHNVY
ncbi:hypothetical protein E2562_014635 [Oryza meyeriana var. granulata]|uniref:F-box domain-containing protein n=1 Tax=Oryza meyeriana var. granulata TaxID=110450 RepID=A0A6G1D4G6_9ORYZ|nr:hypothetical protein E2562_014635 [Oryza meyeriana var. granulata]